MQAQQCCTDALPCSRLRSETRDHVQMDVRNRLTGNSTDIPAYSVAVRFMRPKQIPRQSQCDWKVAPLVRLKVKRSISVSMRNDHCRLW